MSIGKRDLRRCPSPPERVLIIGGGEFGLSAALGLAESNYLGYESLITVLDPSTTPPSVTAASSDLNKIVRSDYSDTMYSNLAKDALSEWRTDLWNNFYVESGIIVLADRTSRAAEYVKKAFKINRRESESTTVHELDSQSIKAKFPAGVPTGAFQNRYAYFNGGCGYAKARGAMDSLCDRVRALGVNFKVGKAYSFIYEDSDIAGVNVKSSEGASIVEKYDFYVAAAGSWTAHLLPEFIEDLVSSGQVVGMIQLTQEEGDTYRKSPVVFSMDSGFYVFPPTEDNIVKFAIHGAGYHNPGLSSDGQKMVSTPRTKDGRLEFENDNIPLEAVGLLKLELAKIYPDLGKRSWESSRLCWYTDSASSNFLIDYHPLHPSLFLATAGSGHAFKFLPIMSRMIRGALEKTLPHDQASAWSFDGLRLKQGDASRGGLGMAKAKRLMVEDMALASHL